MQTSRIHTHIEGTNKNIQAEAENWQEFGRNGRKKCARDTMQIIKQCL